VESTHLFYDLISEQAAAGKTILFSTHLMDHVARLCSHAVIIQAGTVVARGALTDLMTLYGQDNLEALFLHLTSGHDQP
jgi:ABC-2 type transport system ATP-binding protein